MAVYLREQWGSTGERGGYDLPGVVSEAYVHHFGSGIQPARSVDEAMARMRSAQAYHRSLGWFDIGYSWCVDFAGNVYEGRGWNRTGAHTYGYNSKGYGICGLFDSTVFPPSDEMIAGVAWIIREGVELGKITARPTIVGHRDRVPDTACCGDPMYLRLDDIRNQVYGAPVTAEPKGDEMAKAFVAPGDTMVIVSGNRYSKVTAAWPTAHKGLVDLAAAGMLEEHAPGVLWQPISAEALAVLREDK